MLILYLPSINKQMNQCDMVEKLDWGLEDLIHVCPGTHHCEMGKIPALSTLPACGMTVKTKS